MRLEHERLFKTFTMQIITSHDTFIKKDEKMKFKILIQKYGLID